MSIDPVKNSKLVRRNVRAAKKVYPNMHQKQIQVLKSLTEQFAFAFAIGDLVILQNSWFVTHGGLLRLAHRRNCLGIDCELQERLSDPTTGRWVFKATLLKSRSHSFVGYGDADPSNVSSLVHGAEMRVAETRAVNRALRKAYGIGICSVEEIGTVPNTHEKIPPQNANTNGSGGSPKVRDRLCQIIRQHKLDPELVKAYAVDFCGTKTLREASREQVENFVQQLADWAEKDRNALLCQLNSYPRSTQEVVA
jgi:hypothetical protein